MKKILFLLIPLWFSGIPLAQAMPTDITYQGTMKQKNLPANGTHNLLFRITNQDGTQVYWSSGNQAIAVTNGFFAAHLSPSGVDWQNISPYMEVSIEGQLLLPREPVTSTIYASLSESVVDGAITTAKLDPGVQQYLVPEGAVMMFTGPCPVHWTRLAALDNSFAMGSDSYGKSGGAATHTHTISMDGQHDHGGTTEQGDQAAPSAAGTNFLGQAGWHKHKINADGAHNHGGTTGVGNNLPPYVTVVYCQKD